MGYSKRSLMNLEGIHPDLRRVCDRAIELAEQEDDLDFIITDGCRTIEEQKVFVATGRSKTMRSRHLGGFALDYVALVGGRVTYADEPMGRIAELFKEAARELGIPIRWGGDWKSFKDQPHIELDKGSYPDVDVAA